MTTAPGAIPGFERIRYDVPRKRETLEATSPGQTPARALAATTTIKSIKGWLSRVISGANDLKTTTNAMPTIGIAKCKYGGSRQSLNSKERMPRGKFTGGRIRSE